MGSSGGSDYPEKQEVRYAPYLERAHKWILNDDNDVAPNTTAFTLFNDALGKSPYDQMDIHNPDEGMFGYKEDGETLWHISNFPSVYDLFGKFMAGLDVCSLWHKLYEEVVHGPAVNDAISAHSAVLKDEIDGTVMPSFLAGMRDINAINSSSFIVGKALIYDGHIKRVNEFAGNARLKMIEVATQMWSKHLEWNSNVVKMYGTLFELYYNTRHQTDARTAEYLVKHQLWNLNLLDYTRSILGALNGAPAASTGGGSGPSQTQQAVGGALSGAATGAMVGGPWGAAIGGVIGLAGSFL